MARQRQVRLFTLMDVAVEGGRIDDFGARALALVEARRRGAPVVDSWVIPAAAFREIVHAELPPGHEPASLLRAIHKSEGLERAARARERLLTTSLPAELGEELATLAGAEPTPGWGFIVRPSLTIADDTIVDAAGLDTVVAGLQGAEALSRAVCTLWADSMLEDVLRYLRSRRVRDFGVAVVVQRCEPVRASGMLLTRERSWGTREESAVLGSGLGLAARNSRAAGALDVLRIGADGPRVAKPSEVTISSPLFASVSPSGSRLAIGYGRPFGASRVVASKNATSPLSS